MVIVYVSKERILVTDEQHEAEFLKNYFGEFGEEISTDIDLYRRYEAEKYIECKINGFSVYED